ncbi:hypothetical protein [Kiloniella sp.]|uniref:hypothetical protein n=1 Tax=Kiloniella sp. TaxID=1938587 RepID=UPI003B01EEB1
MLLFSHLYSFIALYGDGLQNSYYVVINPESFLIPLAGYFFAGVLILPRFFHSSEYKPGRAVIAALFFFAFFLLAFTPFILQPAPLPYDVLGYDLAIVERQPLCPVASTTLAAFDAAVI